MKALNVMFKVAVCVIACAIVVVPVLAHLEAAAEAKQACSYSNVFERLDAGCKE